ncbi:hypothetical protein BDA99DRAFT_539903 [Phascolomyces articulosus]|uniref:Uncharacterized protein n=1 Tax=Phascolomyces articulosus TaxID=60185 RepID=A0AAD5PBU9_9FUNG|nr:hypothetical protein BDA99DRAFT_539903 [Phascolomyces articulosus]
MYHISKEPQGLTPHVLQQRTASVDPDPLSRQLTHEILSQLNKIVTLMSLDIQIISTIIASVIHERYNCHFYRRETLLKLFSARKSAQEDLVNLLIGLDEKTDAERKAHRRGVSFGLKISLYGSKQLQNVYYIQDQSQSGDVIQDKITGKLNKQHPVIDQGKHKIIYPPKIVQKEPRGRKRIPHRVKIIKFEGFIQQIAMILLSNTFGMTECVSRTIVNRNFMVIWQKWIFPFCVLASIDKQVKTSQFAILGFHRERVSTENILILKESKDSTSRRCHRGNPHWNITLKVRLPGHKSDKTIFSLEESIQYHHQAKNYTAVFFAQSINGDFWLDNMVKCLNTFECNSYVADTINYTSMFLIRNAIR